jgi:cytochrome P450
MSAALFGGSFNLVVSDDNKQKGLLNRYMRRVAIDAQFPFVKYIPGVPSASSILSDMVEKTMSKRRKEMEKGITKNDILQIFVDQHIADPVSFTDKHIRNEMILFMLVCQIWPPPVADYSLGLRGVILRVSLLHLLCSCCSIIRRSFLS